VEIVFRRNRFGDSPRNDSAAPASLQSGRDAGAAAVAGWCQSGELVGSAA